MKRTLPVLACLALAGCLSAPQTVDVELSQSAYNMLYGDRPPPPQKAAATAAPRSGGFSSTDNVTLTVPAATAAPAPAAPQPRVVRTAAVATPAPAPRPAPVAARAPAPAPRPAPAPAAAPEPVDTCGASRFQNLVGGPASATLNADLPSLSRIYGSGETIDPRQTPARLNVVVSTTNPAEALTTGGTVTRIFCG